MRIMNFIARRFFFGREKIIVAIALLVLLCCTVIVNAAKSFLILMIGVLLALGISSFLLYLMACQTRFPEYAVIRAKKFIAKNPETTTKLNELIEKAREVNSFIVLESWTAQYEGLNALSAIIAIMRIEIKKALAEFWKFIKEIERQIEQERLKLLSF
ncbi:MAG: hypothetical protein QMD86_02240 [Patescibacteria group bacterium]|nr:hypothetical protein [Patescibacteria group bacterium]